MDLASPGFILFAQHGWADDNRAMLALAQALATPQAHIVAPSLGYLQTWLRIMPLIEAAEQIARQTLAQHPDLPLRIVGHSMGGLIWLELLHRHPEWWSRVHSLVLVASPVGGSDLSRLIDPIGFGVGIAADLGKTRCAIAEPIAAQIPTLIIAGDIDGGSDGTVPVACTQFANAQFLCLPGLSHAVMRNHPAVASAIQEFWTDTNRGEPLVIIPVINRLRAIEWVTDGHPRDFAKAKTLIALKDGSTLRTWRNSLGILHIYVAAPDGQCLYSGFIGWFHEKELQQTLDVIRAEEGIASA
ncbi:alpha/beta fold hydrolase [Pseudanabaena sp. FACHB-2040]|nr:alpha/beta fold hydrolase [Pseudanabaena sp. FACHB-2040]